ncbi:DUF397 domain-containing protein [Prauserella muralis]|uniref:DUF397 domain-containing protein n=1 Tax=Prauserella muralis TaxID=588067 RepID=A0A2V4B3U6_9PSEU|nr:DUF397 domain-containing protein [Prauserella muralis]PXY28058.1 DUF397 domain-containing protein [Prauserella muralis]TWE22146.1 uncharacterized protein DUF397 [Prauserella muralis]
MVADVDLSTLDWRKSSYSGGGNDCVEVAFTLDGTAVRDSKNPAAGALRLGSAQWDALLAAARTGELDLR